MMFGKHFTDVQDACVLALAIVDTVRQSLMVLDQDLRVVAANRSFYLKFKVEPRDIEGKLLYELGAGGWNIPKLRSLLEEILPKGGEIEDYEVEHEFTDFGVRTLCLNARKLSYEADSHTNILLGIEDITGRRAARRERDKLLRQKDVLLKELQHRVANSLQIIAAIILMKAKAVSSDDTRRHLQDAHQRVLSVAAVQQHLRAAAGGGPIQVVPYLTKLCDALSHSMIGDNRLISLKVGGKRGTMTCRDAESLGLIVTELVINCLKHAFTENTEDGLITVAYDVSGTDWKLSVADNGVGTPDGVFDQPKTGLGTGIVKALAKQLGAQLVTLSGPRGTTVTVTHATFAAGIRAA